MGVANSLLAGRLAERHEQLVAIEPHDVRKRGVGCSVVQDIDLPDTGRGLHRNGSIDFVGLRARQTAGERRS